MSNKVDHVSHFFLKILNLALLTHLENFGASRSTVVFLNNYLSISELTLVVRLLSGCQEKLLILKMVRCTGGLFHLCSVAG